MKDAEFSEGGIFRGRNFPKGEFSEGEVSRGGSFPRTIYAHMYLEQDWNFNDLLISIGIKMYYHLPINLEPNETPSPSNSIG